MYAIWNSEIAFISKGCATSQNEFFATRAEADGLAGTGGSAADPSGGSSAPAEPASDMCRPKVARGNSRREPRSGATPNLGR